MKFNLRTSSSALRKANWLMDFQEIVNLADESTYGKIQWDDAVHLFNSGYTPAEAAARYLSALRNS